MLIDAYCNLFSAEEFTFFLLYPIYHQAENESTKKSLFTITEMSGQGLFNQIHEKAPLFCMDEFTSPAHGIE